MNEHGRSKRYFLPYPKFIWIFYVNRQILIRCKSSDTISGSYFWKNKRSEEPQANLLSSCKMETFTEPYVASTVSQAVAILSRIF